jgi:hypothetical protein
MKSLSPYHYPTETQRNEIRQEAYSKKPLLKIWNPNLTGTPCYKCGLDIDYPGLPPKPCHGCKVPMCLSCQQQPQSSPAVCLDYPLCIGSRVIVNPPPESQIETQIVSPVTPSPQPYVTPISIPTQTPKPQPQKQKTGESVIVYMVQNPGSIYIATTNCLLKSALRFVNSFPLEREKFLLNNIILEKRFLDMPLGAFAPLFTKKNPQYHCVDTICFDFFYPSDPTFNIPVKLNNGQEVVLQTIDQSVPESSLNVIANL